MAYTNVEKMKVFDTTLGSQSRTNVDPNDDEQVWERVVENRRRPIDIVHVMMGDFSLKPAPTEEVQEVVVRKNNTKTKRDFQQNSQEYPFRRKEGR